MTSQETLRDKGDYAQDDDMGTGSRSDSRPTPPPNSRTVFADYHPVVNFAFFASVLAFTMLLMHPLFLAVSLLVGVGYAFYLNGRRGSSLSLKFLLPMVLLAALFNPAFNHEGVTILAYLPDGNPLTLESMVYGVAAGAMLAAVVAWFSTFNQIITSDKFVYLFGRFAPSLSLVLSLALRFVPRFLDQARVISASQAGIGRDVSNGNVIQRAKHGIRMLSILVTWALENGVETADSMKARGYGLPGRTSFSIFKMSARDWGALAYILLADCALIGGMAIGLLGFDYYPAISDSAGLFLGAATPDTLAVLVLAVVYGGLCSLPILLSMMWNRQWQLSLSRA
ncbi:MAG: energy-coupling factor transporter transmembrane protein EcfT [Propionibacteriaceae bacterium]|jgi:energy-coupling factor transport system permease protein|nr:energy-coupling factor transporter transmembrane protein EcfT [Propionibacteriaceae bacterium]